MTYGNIESLSTVFQVWWSSESLEDSLKRPTGTPDPTFKEIFVRHIEVARIAASHDSAEAAKRNPQVARYLLEDQHIDAFNRAG